jgi:hypothetical protein
MAWEGQMSICLRRREFIAAFGGAAALAARAQQLESVPRVAFLTGLSAEDPEGEARLAAFLHGLTERGRRGMSSSSDFEKM